nr:hypothetical transcript [Hymenolepis microstoma]
MLGRLSTLRAKSPLSAVFSPLRHFATRKKDASGVSACSCQIKIEIHIPELSFDLSEICRAGGNETGLESINIHFSCRKASNGTSKDSTRAFGVITHNNGVEPYLDKPQIFPLPTYLRSVQKFAILIQGESCPGFMDQGALLVGVTWF